MKFLHTADWQIGMKAAGFGQAGQVLREERLAASARVMDLANERGCEFALVAGDVFEDNGVDRSWVQRTAEAMARFQGTVYVLPGNHDPLVPGSVWEHPVWGRHGRLRVLREACPVVLPGGQLFPCPVLRKRSGQNPTLWIPAERAAGIRIGVAHGTVEGIRQDDVEYPIPRDTPQHLGLDYLALGHWHSFACFPGVDGQVRMAYSGTPESTGFGERDSGNAVVVSIESPGAPAVLTPLRTGGLSWSQISREIREVQDLTSLRQEIESLPCPDRTLLEVFLSGLLAVQAQPELEALEHCLKSSFLYGSLSICGLLASPTDQTWLSSLPHGVLREAGSRLQVLASQPGPEAEAASQALLELYILSREAP